METPDAPSLAALLVVTVAPLAVLVLLSRDLFRLVRPMQLVLAGRYPEARAAAQRLDRSWLRWLPGVRNAARYMIASTLHLEGDLDGSLEVIRELSARDLDRNLRYATLSLEGANLVLAGRDPSRAIAALREALALHETQEDLLLLAVALHETGRVDEGARAFEEAGAAPGGGRVRLGRTVMLEPKRLKATIFHFARGLYLLRTGRPHEARSDLEAAAAAPQMNVYAERARALVPRVLLDDADPRSSLAPQIMDDR